MREKGWEERGPKAHSKNSDFSTPLISKTHKHKQICGIVPGLGGCQKLVYVFFFSGHSFWGRKKHVNKIPPKNPGTIP